MKIRSVEAVLNESELYSVSLYQYGKIIEVFYSMSDLINFLSENVIHVYKVSYLHDGEELIGPTDVL